MSPRSQWAEAILWRWFRGIYRCISKQLFLRGIWDECKVVTRHEHTSHTHTHRPVVTNMHKLQSLCVSAKPFQTKHAQSIAIGSIESFSVHQWHFVKGKSTGFLPPGTPAIPPFGHSHKLVWALWRLSVGNLAVDCKGCVAILLGMKAGSLNGGKSTEWIWWLWLKVSMIRFLWSQIWCFWKHKNRNWHFVFWIAQEKVFVTMM